MQALLTLDRRGDGFVGFGVAATLTATGPQRTAGGAAFGYGYGYGFGDNDTFDADVKADTAARPTAGSSVKKPSMPARR